MGYGPWFFKVSDINEATEHTHTENLYIFNLQEKYKQFFIRVKLWFLCSSPAYK